MKLLGSALSIASSSSWSIVVVAVFLGGCVLRLPAPPVPARSRPGVSVPHEPPAAGHGRVIIETADGRPSTVYLIAGAVFVAFSDGVAGGGIDIRRLCMTPCVVDLPYGQHELRFTVDGDTQGAGSAYVNVSGRTSVLRVNLGQQKRPGGIALFGGTLELLGIVGAPLGGIGWAVSAEDDDGVAGAMKAVTIMSLGAIAVGAALWQLDKPVEQPASYLQWELDSVRP